MSALFPDFILLKIFGYLSLKELMTVRRVSQRWRYISCDKTFWRRISIKEMGVCELLVTDKIVSCLTSYSKNIELLSLCHCLNITDQALKKVSSSVSRLRFLDLKGCAKVSDKSIEILSRSCSFLESVNLMGTLVTYVGLSYLVEKNKHITELIVSSFSLTMDSLRCISQSCINLIHLEAESSLTFINEKNKSVLSSDMIQILSKCCRQLTILILNYDECHLTNSDLIMLGKYCQDLECLEIYLDSDSWLSDEGLVNFCFCVPNLLALKLNETKVTDYTLFAIASNCSDIEALTLGGCDGVTDHGFLVLFENCKNLLSLSLGVCNSTSASIYFMAKSSCAQNLIHLSLQSWKINDNDLLCISKNIPSLNYLSILKCKFLTNIGLREAVVHWKYLNELDISHTNCATCDFDLFHLANTSKDLFRIAVYGCHGVTKSGIKALQYIFNICVEN
ncbi:F-box/LRR-repeat protein 2 isoform X2 [Hydra vulgaris]|uniref:F-box/LRR-repeat protein 2 isoform X2 n=1 Tax=Hydra vulgaris TaxID=6087 RepID=A0ABM4DN26_HYDVU